MHCKKIYSEHKREHKTVQLLTVAPFPAFLTRMQLSDACCCTAVLSCILSVVDILGEV